MRPRYGFEDDVTFPIEDDKGRPLVARLFWPEDGDRGPNAWGNRRVEYIGDEPMIALYAPSSRSAAIRNDPCGTPFFTLNPRQMDERANVIKGITHLKNGKLRLTPGPPQRDSYPKHYSRTLPKESVDTLRQLFADAAIHRVNRAAHRRERIMTKRRSRQQVSTRLRHYRRGRTSSLAA